MVMLKQMHWTASQQEPLPELSTLRSSPEDKGGRRHPGSPTGNTSHQEG